MKARLGKKAGECSVTWTWKGDSGWREVLRSSPCLAAAHPPTCAGLRGGPGWGSGPLAFTPQCCTPCHPVHSSAEPTSALTGLISAFVVVQVSAFDFGISGKALLKLSLFLPWLVSPLLFRFFLPFAFLWRCPLAFKTACCGWDEIEPFCS